jgi:hypothetical protein
MGRRRKHLCRQNIIYVTALSHKLKKMTMETPIDVFVLSNDSVAVPSILRCKPIGVLSTEDQDGQDSKIIAVPIANIDPNFSSINDIGALSKIKYNIRLYCKIITFANPLWAATSNYISCTGSIHISIS